MSLFIPGTLNPQRRLLSVSYIRAWHETQNPEAEVFITPPLHFRVATHVDFSVDFPYIGVLERFENYRIVAAARGGERAGRHLNRRAARILHTKRAERTDGNYGVIAFVLGRLEPPFHGFDAHGGVAGP
tara:strand:+ start:21529 stop:21915 length:387 start_codon:yes stop_codon:yes gene_type:complete